MMGRRLLATTMAVAVLMLASVASADLDLEALAGQGALEDYFGTDPFEPNETSPQLQITGAGSVENSGGVAVFSQDAFTLDILFLNAWNNESKRSFEDLVLTAGFRPGDTTFGSLRVFDPESPSHYVELPYSAFVDSQEFGLPFPPESTIRGMGTGEADFLSLDGALLAGVDLGVGLYRDKHATEPPKVSVGVQVVGLSDGSKVRFDVFGLAHESPWSITGNNPNSGSGGVDGGPPGPPVTPIPEPATIILLGSAVSALYAARRRERRKRA